MYSFVYSYFSIKGIAEKHITNSNIDEIKFISPDNKLKIGKEPKRLLTLLKKIDKKKIISNNKRICGKIL